jgi:hypothetical protein
MGNNRSDLVIPESRVCGTSIYMPLQKMKTEWSIQQEDVYMTVREAMGRTVVNSISQQR